MIPTREHRASASSIEWVVRMAPRVPCTFLLIVFLIVKRGKNVETTKVVMVVIIIIIQGDQDDHLQTPLMRSGAIRTTDAIVIVCIKLS